MKRRNVVLAATAGTAAGVLGLTALALPAGAGAAPALPPVAPEQLVESVMRAEPPALTGTVSVDNALGLPALPGGEATQLLADGTSRFQVWADGQGRHRVSVPSHSGELTVVDDGRTAWKWDSGEQTATRTEHPERAGHDAPADPAAAARGIIGELRKTSEVSVDGTASVAGRDAYELVLTPKPTERTLLRQVRVAVDAEKRVPLELSVLTNGSADPALKIGFTSVDMTAPDPGLFQFSPPAGAKVEDGEQRAPRPDQHAPQPGEHAVPEHQVVGDGWDSVLVAEFPANPELRQVAERTGKPISGPWGSGWVLGTAAGNALLTEDGRVAVGAVPEQVLTAALGEVR
ncbi:outer membrane lipoprotein carrier protein LolA [Saccharopolyspora hirsuta]|uniref:Outer membrane lipoprotein carrier protein LolA n=1 Tax=Saccharopolyspora hirsuta TaxID=1837 RepID=A0A5M7BBN9_SACHI|nr:outer membrane lipoprotein carrier protein LolA [Saccharopolyspora hirsuta]KAA5826110.1 outer membrane lipoprotein carrier protein LolA [Saccharopolyspora hirsuta]